MADGTVLSCSSSGRGIYIQAWDLNNCSILRTYKNEAEGEVSCMCRADKYLLCALSSKPFIFVWLLTKEQVHTRISCSGLVTALTCHPYGRYCFGAIGSHIHLWEIHTGNMLGQLSYHYQSVSVLHCMNNGAYLLSGGKDCTVYCWDVASTLSDQRSSASSISKHAPNTLDNLDTKIVEKANAYHVWTDHSKAISGLHSIEDGDNIKVVSSSLDQTCKLYNFVSGTLLCTFLFDSRLSTVSLDESGLWLYAGCACGDIFGLPLFLSNRASEVYVHSDRRHVYKFNNHSMPVTKLVLLSSGQKLVSASEDSTCCVWDIQSRQIISTLRHKAAVTDMILCDISRIIQPKLQLCFDSLAIKQFTRIIMYKNEDNMKEETKLTVPIIPRKINLLQQNAISLLSEACGDELIRKFMFTQDWRTNHLVGEHVQKFLALFDYREHGSNDIDELKHEIQELKTINEKLYCIAMKKLQST